MVGKVNGLCYIIQKSLRSKGLVVHVDHLKKYEGVRPIQNWLAETVDDGEAPRRVEMEGPSSSGPQVKVTHPLEESGSVTLLDQAVEMTGLPQPLLPVTDEIADEPGTQPELSLDEFEDLVGPEPADHTDPSQRLEASLSDAEQVLDGGDLDMPLALRRKRRPLKPRDILDL